MKMLTVAGTTIGLVFPLFPVVDSAVAEAVSSGDCTDLHGRTIPQGMHYAPGPDICALCVCDNGSGKWCKSVLCSPPHDCKSFRLGSSCCEFICLDDTLSVPPTTDAGGGDSTADLGLRLVASGVTAILSLSLLFFLIHRLRQKRIRGRQNRQMHEDQRSLGSVGYITGSLGYLPGSVPYLNGQERVDFLYDETPIHYPWWKPPENYFPRGEAPPPYEEAVAAARAEAAQQNDSSNTNNNPAAPAKNQSIVSVHTSGVHTSAESHSQCESAITTTQAEVNNISDESVTKADATKTVDSGNGSMEASGGTSVILPDDFYNDVAVAGPSNSSPSMVRSPSNLTTMNESDLTKSTCSCTVDDPDDYRSECENCKTSREDANAEFEGEVENGAPQETMTLHRRPSNSRSQATGYCTSLTLPSHARKFRGGSGTSSTDPAMQRFSLQLVLDWSDSSSSSLTLSPERRTASPTSSSSSSDINTHI